MNTLQRLLLWLSDHKQWNVLICICEMRTWINSDQIESHLGVVLPGAIILIFTIMINMDFPTNRYELNNVGGQWQQQFLSWLLIWITERFLYIGDDIASISYCTSSRILCNKLIYGQTLPVLVCMCFAVGVITTVL